MAKWEILDEVQILKALFISPILRNFRSRRTFMASWWSGSIASPTCQIISGIGEVVQLARLSRVYMSSVQIRYARPIFEYEKKYRCASCGGPKSYSGEICRNCLSKKQWKCEHPSKEEMIVLLKSYSLSQIAKMYGVSDNSIRKWLQNYNLPYRLHDIKEFCKEE